MADTIKIIESVFDDLKLERAFSDDAGEPRAVISGVLCNLDTKPHLLEAGLAFCQPLDETIAQDWPVYTDAEINGIPERMWNVTNNPEVVRAARQLQSLMV